MQPVEDGRAALILPDGLILNPYAETPDFSRLKTYLRSKVDMEAAAIFKSNVTDIAGQDRRYAQKLAEAQSWAAGADEADPALYPFMVAEAEARSAISGSAVPVSQVRSEVLARSSEVTAAEARIEALRVASKIAVQAGDNICDILQAATVDWNG
ncbi:hypothetical protein [Aurantiacibacter xanthus]|nr:hypothetical protein [Aurantiacibacter xanthus]